MSPEHDRGFAYDRLISELLTIKPSVLWSLLQRAHAWTTSKTFSLRITMWRRIGFSTGALCILTASLGMWLATVVLLAATVLAASAWSTWRTLIQASGRPKIVLARFQSENAPYDEIAHTHVKELERRLRRNEIVNDLAEIYVTPFPLTVRQVNNIMRFAPVLATITGSGLAVRGAVRWEGWVQIHWVSTVGRFKTDDSVLDAETHVAKEHLALPVDAEQPTTSLTAEVFDASHARAAEIAVSLAIGTYWSQESDVVAGITEEPGELPEDLAARLLIARAWARAQDGSPLRAARDLEEHAKVYDTATMWEATQSLFLSAIVRADPRDFSTRKEASQAIRHAARRAITIDPLSLQSHCNLGFQLLARGRRDDARDHLHQALSLAAPSDPANIYPDLVAHSFAVGGELADWSKWQQDFSRVLLEDVPGVLHVIGVSSDALQGDTPPPEFGEIGPDKP